ncbi:sensor histidine kinase [Spirosoma arcticum]
MVVNKVVDFLARRPVNWRQVWTHTFIWIACYWTLTYLHWLFLESYVPDFDLPVNSVMARWLGAGHVAITFIAYYWITLRIIPNVVGWRWPIAIMHGVSVYVLIGLGAYYLYHAVSDSFKGENKRFDKYINGYYGEENSLYSLINLETFFQNWWWFYSVLLVAVFMKVVKEIYLTRNHALQLELNLLRAQINPHFLFNTLNNVYSIVEEKDAYAAEILLKFGDIMRYTLYEVNNEFIDLHQEVSILSDYIELERIRHDDTAPAHIDFAVTGDPNGFAVPPLLLLTLVENAFKHGIHSTIGSSWVRIQLRVDQHKLRFEVSNSKPAVQRVSSSKHKINVHRVGLANIQRRLALLYPTDHTLTISNESDTYSVTLSLINHRRTNLLLGR